MLYEFVDVNRDVIISRTRDRVRSRPWPSVAPGEVEHGVPARVITATEVVIRARARIARTRHARETVRGVERAETRGPSQQCGEREWRYLGHGPHARRILERAIGVESSVREPEL
jgi:hypothetical protein